MVLSKLVAQKLLEIKAIKLSPQSPFTWASGWKSPIYCDNRLTLSYPEIRKIIRNGLTEIAGQYRPFESVVGVATAGIAHGLMLAESLDMPFAYVRSKPKGHGRQNLIEGHVQEGTKAVVVEDLISTGGSLIRAVEALRDSGVEVVGALAIFTYDFDISRSNLKQAGVPFSTLSTYNDLLEEAVNLSYIAESELDTLKEWRKSPDKWQPIS
ncbi:MAG: orotate phosphoribosyltransferase [Saprospiraceae bacterium]|nr:orotate phosphoribosyltransferase [Saprospiraceae bacterium]